MWKIKLTMTEENILVVFKDEEGILIQDPKSIKYKVFLKMYFYYIRIIIFFSRRDTS